MSKWEKLLHKIKYKSKDVRFEEIKKVLESYGYTAYNPSSGSSHWTFRKLNRPPITIPKDNPVKLTILKWLEILLKVRRKTIEGFKLL